MSNFNMSVFDKLPKVKPDGKILLLTHTDMDGSGPAVILKAMLPAADITVTHCNNGEMSKMIVNAAEDTDPSHDYDNIIITDISCSEDDAKIVDKSANVKKIILLDHHITAKYLNDYKWAVVSPGHIDGSAREDKYASSGASLILDYLMSKDFNASQKTINFANLIERYDTWDWVNVDAKRDMEPFYLNQLFFVLGQKYFESRMTDRMFEESDDIFDATDRMLIEIETSKIEDIKKQVKHGYKTGTFIFNNETELTIAYVDHNKNLPAAFEAMKEDYPDADIYLCNYGTGVSIRTGDTEKISAAEIASIAGGGGHKDAGGAKYDEDAVKNLMFGTLKLRNIDF